VAARQTQPDQHSLYQKILCHLLDQSEFTLAEITEPCLDRHPLVTRRILQQLILQGSLSELTEAGEPRYRWREHPVSFDIPAWVAAQITGTQLTAAPLSDRPRERLLAQGAPRLKISELLAILIRSGRPGESALQAGEKIAGRLGEHLERLPDLGLAELREISRAVSEPAFCQIMAGIELGRRVHAASDAAFRPRTRISGPADAVRFCLERFDRLARDARQEEFHMVTLDSKNHPITCHQITVGTLRNSLVHPREVFRPAIRDAANSILVVHNHPSGDLTPSDQDLHVTERLESAAEIVGIPLVDHIIVAGGRGISLREWRAGSHRTASI
jgi:DNA repair protein RadC